MSCSRISFFFSNYQAAIFSANSPVCSTSHSAHVLRVVRASISRRSCYVVYFRLVCARRFTTPSKRGAERSSWATASSRAAAARIKAVASTRPSATKPRIQCSTGSARLTTEVRWFAYTAAYGAADRSNSAGRATWPWRRCRADPQATRPARMTFPSSLSTRTTVASSFSTPNSGSNTCCSIRSSIDCWPIRGGSAIRRPPEGWSSALRTASSAPTARRSTTGDVDCRVLGNCSNDVRDVSRVEMQEKQTTNDVGREIIKCRQNVVGGRRRILSYVARSNLHQMTMELFISAASEVFVCQFLCHFCVQLVKAVALPCDPSLNCVKYKNWMALSWSSKALP